MTGKNLLALLLLSASAVVSVVQGECPDADKITPCFCQKDGTDTVATCADITSVRDLENFAQNSDGYRYTKVIIRDSKLDSIPAVFAEKVAVNALELRNLQLKKWFSDIPSFDSSVTEMTLEKLEAEDFNWNYLQHATNLKKLTVDHTHVPTITTDFNRYVTHGLTDLTFTNTDTATVERGAVKDFMHLESYAIISNDLTDLNRSSIPDPFNGKVIYFQNNKLTRINEQIFSNVPNLEAAYFNGNRIERIDEPSEQGVLSNIRKVEVADNPLNCDCYIKWVPVSSVKNFNGICAAPKKFKGKYLTSLTVDDFSDC